MKTFVRSIRSVCLLAVVIGGAPVLLGAADAPTTQPDQTGPEKFYGQITAVDTKAKTFAIGEQTFVVVADTQMTKAADDSAATLADATVGDYARGTYVKASDGKLNVTKVRFGRKAGGSKGGKGGKKKGATTQPEAQ